MNSMVRQKDRTLKDELPRSVGAHLLPEITGEITPERMKGWSQSKNNTLIPYVHDSILGLVQCMTPKNFIFFKKSANVQITDVSLSFQLLLYL